MRPTNRIDAAGLRAGALEPRVHAAGCGALLFDVAQSAFDPGTQARLWALASSLAGPEAPAGVRDIVPGVNNLMLVFDPLQLHPVQARAQLLQRWNQARADALPGRDIVVPVVYGGPGGEDLEWLAARVGLNVEALVQAHVAATYAVACIGAYPGFAYLSGLPAELAQPRRSVPRARVAAGSVMIGGAQAGVMPCDGPSGWHVLGRTDLILFDPNRARPCLFTPGDRVRFHAVKVES